MTESLYVENEKYLDILFLANFVLYNENDSKTFVDLFLRKKIEEIGEDFDKLIEIHCVNLSELKKSMDFSSLTNKFKEDFQFFIERNFEHHNVFEEINNFENLIKRNEQGDLLNTENQNQIIKKIIKLWENYARKHQDFPQDLSTQIKMDGVFFVPGGRFTELYYWDSYWILIGLLECGMEESAFNLVKCFTNLIKQFGYIPNGTRTYYLGRSQPPFYCQMIYRLYLNTESQEIKDYILSECLEQAFVEYTWFMTNRLVDPKKIEDGLLNQYDVKTNNPRPESFKEDLNTFFECREEVRGNLFRNIQSACESGWDFSTRWFADGVNLSTIDIINIVPVDLNCLLLENERILIFLYNEKKIEEDKTTEDIIENLLLNRIRRWESMDKWLFNNEEGCWFDYNFRENRANTSRFYFSNVMPLFYSDDFLENKKLIYKILYKYSEDLFGHPGGVPVSGKIEVGNVERLEQWDFPNTWAPHVQMLIEFLLKIQEDKMAFHVAKSFMCSVLSKENSVNSFYEKYDVTLSETKAGGGEYVIQEGFGWTNGTVAYIVRTFKDRLEETFSHLTSYLEIVDYLKGKIEECEILEAQFLEDLSSVHLSVVINYVSYYHTLLKIKTLNYFIHFFGM